MHFTTPSGPYYFSLVRMYLAPSILGSNNIDALEKIGFDPTGNSIRLPGAYALSTQKSYFWPNIMHLYIHNLSAIVKFHLMVYVEKTKIVMWNVLFLASKFIFFTLATRHIDLSWNDFVGM
jgi:hypothetical protein